MSVSDLPNGWFESTIGDIADTVRGVTYKKDDATDSPAPGMVPLIRATNIHEALDFEELVYVPDKYVGENQLLRAGDIVLAASSGSQKVVGKAARLHDDWDGSFGAFCMVLRPSPDINSKLLSYYMQTSEYRHRVSELSAGVNINNLRREHVESTPYRLIPRREQNLIVAELEALFTDLDAAVAGLKRVQANLKRYRASVLKAACEGRLVPTEAELAGKEGRTYETGEQLLARILKERRAKWESDQLAKMLAAGKPPSNDDWKKKYQEPDLPDTGGLPALPEGWVWTSLGRAFEVFVGATPSRAKPEYWNGDIPWVSSGEVAFCRIHETREQITQIGLANSSTKRHPPGTVLLGMIGEGKTRGQTAILDISACNNQNSAALRVSEAGVPPEYVYRYLESEYEQTRRIGSGNNQPALNKTRVENMRMPFPPLEEQKRIVAEVELSLSSVDVIEREVKRSLARADRLRQAILKRAFEGKLVLQDPTDEPASALLERIRAERAAKTSTAASPGGNRRVRILTSEKEATC